jgi:glycolate oxidase FAD binding subunit
MFFGLDDRRAGEAMTRAMGASAEVSGAAHLPAYAAGRPPLSGEMAVTALRLEGFEASVQARAEALAGLLTGFGRVQQLEGGLSRDFWAGVREVAAFAGEARPLWRLSVPPASGWKLGPLAGDLIYDWAGGLVWLLPDPSLDAAAIRQAARALGGHATLMRGEGAPAFEPLEGPLAALSARVKAAFDPQGVLNPGRMAVNP